LRSHLRYLGYVLRHKWHVAYAGVRLGVPFWQLLIHDWTKFTPAEWGPYVRRFFAGRGSKWEKDADPTEFHTAWRHHWTRNPHHWEYWLSEAVSDADNRPRRMPDVYVREMVADWYGAGMAQGKPDIASWYSDNQKRMRLHDSSRELAQQVIQEAKRKRLIP
jgi:hypothetical protein